MLAYLTFYAEHPDYVEMLIQSGRISRIAARRVTSVIANGTWNAGATCIAA